MGFIRFSIDAALPPPPPPSSSASSTLTLMEEDTEGVAEVDVEEAADESLSPPAVAVAAPHPRNMDKLPRPNLRGGGGGGGDDDDDDDDDDAVLPEDAPACLSLWLCPLLVDDDPSLPDAALVCLPCLPPPGR